MTSHNPDRYVVTERMPPKDISCEQDPGGIPDRFSGNNDMLLTIQVLPLVLRFQQSDSEMLNLASFEEHVEGEKRYASD